MGGIKTQDIPLELRTWFKLFDKASYRHDYSRVFDDFLTMTITQFMAPGEQTDAWHAEAMRPYSVEEKAEFTKMYFELFVVLDKILGSGNRPHYDVFGHIYELLASKGKKSGLGQFFTPCEVVDVMNELTLGDMEPGAGKRIVDPTCGSGRMLFIAHTSAPGNFQYGIDIDSVCAKMSALNMMFHGCVGEVVCGDGLFLDKDWRFGLAINPILTHHGVPSIMRIEKDCSYIWRQWAHWEKEFQDKKAAAPQAPAQRPRKEKPEPELVPLKMNELSQLSIFDT